MDEEDSWLTEETVHAGDWVKARQVFLDEIRAGGIQPGQVVQVEAVHFSVSGSYVKIVGHTSDRTDKPGWFGVGCFTRTDDPPLSQEDIDAALASIAQAARNEN